MKTKILFTTLLLSIISYVTGQVNNKDTINLKEVTITSNRLPILLSNNPGSNTLVTPDVLSIMLRSTVVEEALRLVPGVRIDNQHDGERIHLSKRGKGILTERG